MTSNNKLPINEYDELCQKIIPGYTLSFEMSNLYLSKLLKKNAHLINIGCGTCHEVVVLASDNPLWQFCALDPSKEMIDTSLKKIESAGLKKQVGLICGYIDTIPETEQFDAATLCLVLARIIGNENKLNFLQKINNRIKNNGYLIYLDLFIEENNSLQTLQDEIWGLHGLKNKLSPDFIANAQNFGKTELHFNTCEIALDLFEKAGFREPLMISSACSYRTYLLKKL